jgi:hypothetical protein
MCYSSRIEADYRRYVREMGARITFHEYHRLFSERADGRKIKIPRAVEEAFLIGETCEKRAIAGLIRAHRAAETVRLKQEVFAQRTRLADAERKMALKPSSWRRRHQRMLQQQTRCGWI